MRHQVMWNKCNVFRENEEPITLDRGDIVPEGIDEFQLSMLVTIGAARIVDDAPERPAAPEPSSPSEPSESDELVKPSPDEPKAAWVDYASDERNSRRISRSEANGMSKSALMDLFK